MSKSIRKGILSYRNILAAISYCSSLNSLYLKAFQQKLYFFIKKYNFLLKTDSFCCIMKL